MKSFVAVEWSEPPAEGYVDILPRTWFFEPNGTPVAPCVELANIHRVVGPKGGQQPHATCSLSFTAKSAKIAYDDNPHWDAYTLYLKFDGHMNIVDVAYSYPKRPKLLRASVSATWVDDLDHWAATRSPALGRRQRLARAPRKPKWTIVETIVFQRNPDVSAEVRLRAGGHCENCKSPAPFLRASDRSPFLEVHHKVLLADGGDDTVENAIALCPNCHRKMHFG